MSTIAWDGVSLAADNAGWIGGAKFRTKKIFRRFIDGKECLCAVFGSLPFGLAALDYIAEAGERPDPKNYGDDESLDIAFIWPKGESPYTLTAGFVKIPVYAEFRACGAGREFAMGAMAAGATAEQAVLIAADHSDYSAFGATVLQHQPLADES